MSRYGYFHPHLQFYVTHFVCHSRPFRSVSVRFVVSSATVRLVSVRFGVFSDRPKFGDNFVKSRPISKILSLLETFERELNLKQKIYSASFKLP